MGRDARINPVEGDVLAIGISQWTVHVVKPEYIGLLRMGSYSTIDHGKFRSFFKLASTVRYGDEQ